MLLLNSRQNSNKFIESNERIQNRKSEALENAADNVGFGRSVAISQ